MTALILGLALAGLSSIASSGATTLKVATSSPRASSPYKVAFILDGPLNDGGFDTAINIGMQQVKATFGSKVQITYKLNVPESPESAQVIDSLVQSGNQMIFATSFGYHTFMAAAAKQYPSVKFLQYESTELASNLSESYIGIDQAWYLAGMAAGALTKDNKLGFVGSFPIPSLLIQVNGFELGAQAVNPKATTRVLWMNSWYSPSAETQAAKSLVSSGIDVLADGVDDPAVVQTGESLGVPVIGHDQPGMRSYAPKEWVTGALFLFGPYYVSQIKAALNGTWHSSNTYGLLKDGDTGLAPFGPAYKSLPASSRNEIQKREQELASGTFNDLTGPIYSQKGTLEIPAGQQATITQRETMSYLVKGVLGTA
jgi:basic membrane lipoprotein Med (substrate-binding protein (PBP1-ABC) superfamily)